MIINGLEKGRTLFFNGIPFHIISIEDQGRFLKVLFQTSFGKSMDTFRKKRGGRVDLKAGLDYKIL